jgi:hypothetical protein
VRAVALAAALALLAGPASAWEIAIDGSAGDDAALAVAVDPTGIVAAAGRMAGAGTGADFTVAKLGAADGSAVWPPVRIDGAAHVDDQANAVAIDASGNVVAAGFLADAASGKDFVVVSLDAADGHERWRYVLAGGFAGGDDEANAVAVDAHGDVLAAGFTQEAANRTAFAVVKLSGATGALAWPAVVKIDGSAHTGNTANALALDAAGDAVAAGFTANAGQGIDFTVAKLAAADGAQLWLRTIDGTSHGADGADAVAVDGGGNVAAAGFTTNGPATDFTVVRLDGATGAPLWPAPAVVHGTGTDYGSEARGVAADPSGNAIATGVIDDTGTDANLGLDFAVVAFRAADGGQLWRTNVKGTGAASLSDDAFSVALDVAGNPAAAGRVESAAGDGDFTLVRLSRTDGRELWRYTANGTATASLDAANAVAVDAAGNVVGAGVTVNATTAADFAVVKLGCAGQEPATCADPATCYDAKTCDPGEIDCTTAPDGTPCSDGDSCTQGDACLAGACLADDASTVRCGLAAALAEPACAADRIPLGVKRAFTRARKLSTRGAAQANATKAKKLFAKARAPLGHVPAALAKATTRRRHPLSAGCAAALLGVATRVDPALARLAM